MFTPPSLSRESTHEQVGKRGEAEDGEAGGVAEGDEDERVDKVEGEEPEVLDDPVGGVAEAVHLHHGAQPVLLLVHQAGEHAGQEELREPDEEERAEQAREVEAQRAGGLGHVHEAQQARAVAGAQRLLDEGV